MSSQDETNDVTAPPEETSDPDTSSTPSTSSAHHTAHSRVGQRHPEPYQWRSVNPYAFTIGCLLIVLFSHIASYLTPYKLYFSFVGLLFDASQGPTRWVALFVKLAIPVVTGFILFILPFYWSRVTAVGAQPGNPVSRYLTTQADLSVRMAAFFAGLLMAWPFISYWEIMARPDILPNKIPFLIVYLLYCISYSYFGGVGVALAKWRIGDKLSEAERQSIKGPLAITESIRTSILGAFTSALATFFAANLSAHN